jgi:hypothetical protein
MSYKEVSHLFENDVVNCCSSTLHKRENILFFFFPTKQLLDIMQRMALPLQVSTQK